MDVVLSAIAMALLVCVAFHFWRRGPMQEEMVEQKEISEMNLTNEQKEMEMKIRDALQDAKICASLVTPPARTPSDVVSATASVTVPSSSTTVGQVKSAVTQSGKNSDEPSASNGVSVRIERLMQMRSKYASATEFEIESSKDHWSELTAASGEHEENTETDVEIFQRWRKQWGHFFDYFGDSMILDQKIAEGGQAEIFKITSNSWFIDNYFLLKVFKEGYPLRELEKQFSLGMLYNKSSRGREYFSPCASPIHGATLLKNGRFAFMLKKHWGDLRKLIDLRMQHNQNQRPPFGKKEVGHIILRIALGMSQLHKHEIIHRDLKASNVLVSGRYDFLDDVNYFRELDPLRGKILLVDVADFECSGGVVGTGYWRAPEILQAVQLHDIKPHLFTEKSDVYSFSITCYEILTGCMPFEGLGRSDYNVVIEGQRPKLPEDIDPVLEALLNRCWNAEPSERPSFEEIYNCLKSIYRQESTVSKVLKRVKKSAKLFSL